MDKDFIDHDRYSVSVDSSNGRKECRCGILMGKWTSWTELNPGRRFYGCRNYKDSNKFCRARAWIDPELTDHYKGLINVLKEKLNKYEKLEEFEPRTETRAVKMMQLTHELEEWKMKAATLESENGSLRSINVQLEGSNEKLRRRYLRMKENALEMHKCVGKCKRKEQVYILVIGVVFVVIALLVVSKNVLVVKQKMLPF